MKSKPECPKCGAEMSPDFSDIYTTFPPKRPCGQCDWVCLKCGHKKKFMEDEKND